MQIRRLLKVALCVALSLTLATCETTGGDGISSKSGTRSRLVAQTDDYRRTIVEAVSVGAVVGGLATALITAAAGGSGRDVARNGLIGAAIGGAVGGIAGKDIADRKRSYVEREDSLNAVIRQARANNAKLSGMVSTATALVRQRRTEAAALKKASASQKQTLASSISADESALSAAISASEREIDQLKSLKARYNNSSAFNSQIGTAEARQRELINARRSLTDIRGQVR